MHAVRLAGPRLGARLLILGCGTIGLSCCLVARSLGFARIVCTDADAAKGKLAAGAGADVFPDAGGRVVEEALLALGGDADVTIVPSGHSRALQEATEVTRPGGEVIVVSFFGGPAPVPLADVVRRESSVRGACLSTPVDFTDALDWIAKGTIDPLTLVTHHFTLEEAARVLHMGSIAPVDSSAIEAAARETGRIVVAEEHVVNGGLGGAVSEVVVRTCPAPVLSIGIPNVFAPIGPSEWLFEHFGLTPARIAERIWEWRS